MKRTRKMHFEHHWWKLVKDSKKREICALDWWPLWYGWIDALPSLVTCSTAVYWSDGNLCGTVKIWALVEPIATWLKSTSWVCRRGKATGDSKHMTFPFVSDTNRRPSPKVEHRNLLTTPVGGAGIDIKIQFTDTALWAFSPAFGSEIEGILIPARYLYVV